MEVVATASDVQHQYKDTGNMKKKGNSTLSKEHYNSLATYYNKKPILKIPEKELKILIPGWAQWLTPIINPSTSGGIS